jgi:hypothetical protein
MLFLLENAPSPPHLALLPRRAVAQLGSALEWGSRGRGFESRRPDQFSGKMLNMSRLYTVTRPTRFAWPGLQQLPLIPPTPSQRFRNA